MSRTRSDSESRSLDSALGRYAIATAAAFSATVGAEAAITNLTQTGGFTLPNSVSVANFDFIDPSGIKIRFEGVRENPYVSSFSTYVSLGRIGANLDFFAGSVGIMFQTDGLPRAVNYGLNAQIPTDGFAENASPALRGKSLGGNFGNFVGSGYLGFFANMNSASYVGWLRVHVGLNPSGVPISFNVVAIDGISGAFATLSEGINAGQIAPIPEPASAAAGLGLLALGAAGLRRRRALLAGRN